MPKSMRKQARVHKADLEKGLEFAKLRKQAKRLLKEGKNSLREMAHIANVDKSTLSRITKCLRNIDEPALTKMLSSTTYNTAAETVLQAEEVP